MPLPIQEAYNHGYHQALRDVFSLLKHRNCPSLESTIQRGHLFDLQDDSFRTTAKEDLVTYYYQHHKAIQYYPLWGAFLRNDLPIPNLPYAILDNYSLPSTHIVKARSIYNAIQSNEFKKAYTLTSALSYPEIYYSRRILLECFELGLTSKAGKKRTKLFSALLYHLIKVGDQHTFQRIQKSLAQAFGPSRVNHSVFKSLTEICNLHNSNIQYPDSLISQYANSQYIDFIKERHYVQLLGIPENNFSEKIDFHGKLFSALKLGQYFDEDQLIHIMLQSEDPKALYYIASKWYVYTTKESPRADELMHILTAFIDYHIQVNTPTGQAYSSTTKTTNSIVHKSVLAFWLNNYKHYEWNSDLKKYVNKNILKKDKIELIQLYKNLNKDDTDFALRSYWKLIHSDPILLAEVDKTYSKKLLNYNQQLPSRKYKYLLQLSRLVDYCKRNTVNYIVNKELSKLLGELESADGISEIIRIEDEIIDNLTIDDITAFEIWSIVHSGTDHIKYSATRITNLFYARHLDVISVNQNQLKLFLKKGSLFKQFGDHGSSKYYLGKIAPKNQITERLLLELKTRYIDEDILSSLQYLVDYKRRNQPKNAKVLFNDFLKSPRNFKEDEIIAASDYSKKSLNRMIENYSSKYSAQDKYMVLQWIGSHLPEELIPLIVEIKSYNDTLVTPDNIKVEANDIADQILSLFISSDQQSSKEWISKYDPIFKDIFNNDLGQLHSVEKLNISTINDLVASKYYNPSTRSKIIEALPRVYPTRNISACKIEPKLNLTEIKQLLPQIKSKNALNYLLKITDVDKNDDVVAFLIAHAKEMSPDKAGQFFNDLFKKQWFANYIDAPETSSDLKTEIQWVLTSYWEAEASISAFEEDQTILNIIKIELAGKTIQEKIKLIIASFVDNEIKLQTIKKIIYQIDYDSIPLLIEFYDDIVEIGGVHLFSFISEDFGIPIEDISDRRILESLIADIKNLSPKDLYYKYLGKIGIKLKTESGVLDIKKAYQIITEDLVRPFVGTGGSVRDIYVFGTIKLLEIEFKRTLGFHKKLNESQSFYKYTAKKRALTWAKEIENEMKIAL